MFSITWRAGESWNALEHARRWLIKRRLPLFGFAWLSTIAAWAIVLHLEHRIGEGPVVEVIVAQAVLLAIVIALCRAEPSGDRVRPLAFGLCVVLGFTSTGLFAAAEIYAEVLAFVLLTLYLMAALLFAWGWQLELWLMIVTLLPCWFLLPSLEFFVSGLEVSTCIAIGAALSLAIAEASARTFRISFLRRESEDEMRRELEASRNAYRDLAENAQDLIYSIDLDGRFTYVNEALARFMGEPASAVLGRVSAEILFDHPLTADVSQVMARLGAGESIEPQLFLVRSIHGPRWVEAVASSMRGVSGRVVGARGIGRDVTERRRAEDALRESEERFRNVFENAPIGMAVVALDGRTIQVNRALCDMLGFDENELLATSIQGVTHPADLSETVTNTRRILGATGGSSQLETRYVHKRGHLVWCLLSASLVRSAGGEPLYVIAQMQDITKRKHAEEMVRDSEQRYRELIESQQDVVVRFDGNGRVTFANDSLCRTLGHARESLLGRNFLHFVHEEDRQAAIAALRSLSAAPYRATLENRTLTEHGWRWFNWESRGIEDDQGSVVAFQSVGRDVTDRRIAEAALRASLDELRRSEEKLRLLAQRQARIREEERKRLGFDLHDDVCQELVGVAIMVASLRRRLAPLPADAGAELDRITGYLNEVVEHLRLLARELRPMLLRDLGLEGSLRSLLEGMSLPSTTVVARFVTTIPRLDEDTEVAVYRIAQEALANAVRHASARSIVVTLAITEDGLSLEVRDDGRGFLADDRRRDALGLVSMEERALALGGSFEVWSEPGRGTAVRLECPLPIRTPASAA